LRYLAGFGVRRPMTGNQQDLKEAIRNKWKEVTVETVRKSIPQWKKTTECGEKAEWRRDSAHFPLIAVTGYRSYAVRRVILQFAGLKGPLATARAP